MDDVKFFMFEKYYLKFNKIYYILDFVIIYIRFI